MNLHGIVRGAINAVNPDIPAVLKRSTGEYDTAPDGGRTPQYVTCTGNIQVQGVNGRDLEHVNNMNIQGVLRTVFLPGQAFGVIRASQQGGDLLHFAEPSGGKTQAWRVVHVLETWPEWSKVIVCLQ
ncbi:MAG: hypothetical protein EOO69_04515 [Moraxellaceae bacterium]|nr:MAG: hypothetical protein EOO69_04515 [Moraxellaceae bacterium]